MADVVVTQITILKDSDRTFSVRVVNQDDGSPFDLTGLVEIEAMFDTGNPSTPLKLTFTGGQITLVPGSPGKVQIFMTRTQSVTLKAGDSQSFEMLILVGTNRSIVQFVGGLNVVERIFPGVE